MHEQNTSTLVVLDLDNTVWYGNYQRHGYLFSELPYRLKHSYALILPVQFPFDQFLLGWSVYKANLHLTAPQQLDMFLDLLITDGFLKCKQEVLEWYELLKSVLEDTVLENNGKVRRPHPLTTEIANFAQLNLHESITTNGYNDFKSCVKFRDGAHY